MLDKIELPFKFRKELSRTFQAYYNKYETYIKRLAYPANADVWPNQRIREESSKYWQQ